MVVLACKCQDVENVSADIFGDQICCNLDASDISWQVTLLRKWHYQASDISRQEQCAAGW